MIIIMAPVMMMMMMMTVMMIASKSSRLPCLSPAAMLQDFFTSAIWFVGSNYWLVGLFICLLIGSNYYFVIFFSQLLVDTWMR